MGIDSILSYNDIVRQIIKLDDNDQMQLNKKHMLLLSKETYKQDILKLAHLNNAFDIFTTAIEETDPEVFSILIANLDSKPDQYITLYDLFEEFNNINKSKIVFPKEALKLIDIRK